MSIERAREAFRSFVTITNNGLIVCCKGQEIGQFLHIKLQISIGEENPVLFGFSDAGF